MRAEALPIMALLMFSASALAQSQQSIRNAAETLEGGNLNRASRAAGDALALYRESETKALAAKARAAR